MSYLKEYENWYDKFWKANNYWPTGVEIWQAAQAAQAEEIERLKQRCAMLDDVIDKQSKQAIAAIDNAKVYASYMLKFAEEKEKALNSVLLESEREANAILTNCVQKLEQALFAFCDAHAMPSYGNYADIDYTPPKKTYDNSYHGGDCSKHGRYYGRCYSCAEEWENLKRRADRDAIHARDGALRKADELARKALECKQ